MKQVYVLISVLFLNCINLLAQTTDIVTGLNGVTDILLNGNDLYFCESTKISKIDITVPIPSPVDVVAGLNGLPVGLAISGNNLYFSINSENKILKIDVTEATPTPVDVMTGIYSIGLAIKGNDLYICETTKISKINITETMPTPMNIVTGISPKEIVLNGDDLYYSNSYFSDRSSIFKINITENTPTPYTMLDRILPNRGLAIYREPGNSWDMYWGHIYGITYYDRWNASLHDNTIQLSGVYGLAVNEDDLYFSNYLENKISKVGRNTLSTKKSSYINSIKLYPNPSSDFIELSGLNTSKKYILHNILGEEVITGIISDNEKIDIQSLINGLYLLKFENGTTMKFIKE